MDYKRKYREILCGYERYSFSEEVLKRNEGMLDCILLDRQACERCDGEHCLTTINSPYAKQWKGYRDLCHKSIKLYDRPAERVYPCPGPDQRKRDILEQIQTPRVLAGAEQWEEEKNEIDPGSEKGES